MSSLEKPQVGKPPWGDTHVDRSTEEETLAHGLEENREPHCECAKLAERRPAAPVCQANEEERKAEAAGRLQRLAEAHAVALAVERLDCEVPVLRDLAAAATTGAMAQALAGEIGCWSATEEVLARCCHSFQAEFPSCRASEALGSLGARLRSQRAEMRGVSEQLDAQVREGGGSSSSTAPAARSVETEELAAVAEATRLCERHRTESEELVSEQPVAWLEEWELEYQQTERLAQLSRKTACLEVRLADLQEHTAASAFYNVSDDELAVWCGRLGLDVERLAAWNFREALKIYVVRGRVREADLQDAESAFLIRILLGWSHQACLLRNGRLEEEIAALPQEESSAYVPRVHVLEVEVANMQLEVQASSSQAERFGTEAENAAEDLAVEESDLLELESERSCLQRSHDEMVAENSKLLDDLVQARCWHPEELPAARALAVAEAHFAGLRRKAEAESGQLAALRRAEEVRLHEWEERVAYEERMVQGARAAVESKKAEASIGQCHAEFLCKERCALQQRARLRVELEAEHECEVQRLLATIRHDRMLQRAYEEELRAVERASSEAGALVLPRLCALAAKKASLLAERRAVHEQKAALAFEAEQRREERARELGQREAKAAARLAAVPQVEAALQHAASGRELPEELACAAAAAVRELEPDALVSCALACASARLQHGTLHASLAAAVRDCAGRLSGLALASAARSLAVLSALDAATHRAIGEVASCQDFEVVE